MNIGVWELLIVLAIVLLIFGPKALPKLGKSAGKTVKYFKKSLGTDDDDDDNEEKGNKDDCKSVSNSEEEE